MKARRNERSQGTGKKQRRKSAIMNALAVIALAIPLGLVVLNIYNQESADTVRELAAELPDERKLILPSHVCMASNVFLGSDQTALHNAEGTYYACSPHCAKLLSDSGDERYAVDPVSNNVVNKASAFICAHPDRSGKICYFESKDNHTAYVDRLEGNKRSN